MRATQLIDREIQLGDGAGLEVLHEYVGTREHGGEHRLVLGLCQIEADRFLAAIEPDEIRALANIRAFTPVFGSRQFVVIASEIAPGPLDLDHACAGIGQPAAAHRRGDCLLQRDDQKTGERERHQFAATIAWALAMTAGGN
jgi:hypothetical protein